MVTVWGLWLRVLTPELSTISAVCPEALLTWTGPVMPRRLPPSAGALLPRVTVSEPLWPLMNSIAALARTLTWLAPGPVFSVTVEPAGVPDTMIVVWGRRARGAASVGRGPPWLLG